MFVARLGVAGRVERQGVGEALGEEVADAGRDQDHRARVDVMTLEVERRGDHPRDRQGDRVQAERLLRRSSETRHALERGQARRPVGEAGVDLRDDLLSHGRVLEQRVDETGDRWRRVEQRVAVEHLGVRDHVPLGERSAVLIRGGQQEVDQIGLAPGPGRLSAMLRDDLSDEGVHPEPRHQVSGPQPGDGGIAPQPGAHGDPREGDGVPQSVPEGAVGHRQPELLAEDEAGDVRDPETLPGLPAARDSLGPLRHPGHVVRDRLAGKRRSQHAADVAVALARRDHRVVLRTQLAGKALVHRYAVEAALAAVEEELVGLRAGEDRVTPSRHADAVDRSELLVPFHERGQGVSKKVEAVPEDRDTRCQRRAGQHGRTRMHLDCASGKAGRRGGTTWLDGLWRSRRPLSQRGRTRETGRT